MQKDIWTFIVASAIGLCIYCANHSNDKNMERLIAHHDHLEEKINKLTDKLEEISDYQYDLVNKIDKICDRFSID